MIAFIHIPKNGGSTVNNFFKNIFKNEYIGFGHFSDNDPAIIVKDNYIYCDLDKISPEKKIVSGHILYTNYKSLKKDKQKFISFVRNPVDRTISNFFFRFYNVNNSKLFEDFNKTETFHNFLDNIEKNPIFTPNEQYLYLRDNNISMKPNLIPSKIASTPKSKLNSEIICLIQQEVDLFLKNYTFIGLTDRMEESLNIFCKTLNSTWSLKQKMKDTLQSKNLGKYSQEESKISKKNVNKILNLNWIDRYIYEKVSVKYMKSSYSIFKIFNYLKLFKK